MTSRSVSQFSEVETVAPDDLLYIVVVTEEGVDRNGKITSSNLLRLKTPDTNSSIGTLSYYANNSGEYLFVNTDSGLRGIRLTETL